jgi:glycosyltransferase involved in cell wall biosynthesis
LKKKKVSIIGVVGLPARYGGFETLTQYLVHYLKDKYDFTVYCSAKSYKERLESYSGAKLCYVNLNANGVQSIPYDIISIFRALKSSDTLLILGVSGCIILPFVKFFSRKRIVVNIDGLEWKREKWGRCARLFLKFSEKLAVKWADVIISDNKIIQDYVLDEYGVQSKLIAYGADHARRLPASDSLLKKYPFLKKRYAFGVCRIEPENNVHLILDAFSHCEILDLIIIGNWHNSKYAQSLYVEYSKYTHIHLLDAIYDEDILGEIRSNCTLYLHGHSAGGTNPSLVEAMYLQLPIFAFDVLYNRETTKEKAYYFKDVAELEKLLQNLDAKELKQIAFHMKDIAYQNYIWEKIAHEYAEVFNLI